MLSGYSIRTGEGTRQADYESGSLRDEKESFAGSDERNAVPCRARFVALNQAYTALRAAIQRESLVGRQSKTGRASGLNFALRSNSESVWGVK